MSRVVKLSGVSNVRDLGGIPLADGRAVKPGLLYRGAALSAATDDDLHILGRDCAIECVVDVRCGWERRESPDRDIPGVENIHIPFYDLDIVGIEYTEPAQGTKTVGRDVACEPVNFYRSLSNELTVGQMARGVQLIFEHAVEGRPVYIHCSGGKDRAGIMALLVLTVLGADREEILSDYLLTNVSRDRHYDEMLARFRRFANGDEELARELTDAHRARPENLATFYEAIEDRYESMDAFVRNQLGLSDAHVEHIRAACTVAPIHVNCDDAAHQ